MRKFLVALVASVAIFTTPVYAGNSEEVIIGVMGGVIGGLIIGDAIGHHHHHRHRHVRVYENPPPAYIYRGECFWREVEVYNTYTGRYEVHAQKYCR